MTIDALTGDDVINAAESSGVVTVTGTISGDYSIGDVVTLTTAVSTYTGTVAAGGIWSVDVAAGGLGVNGSQVAQVSILAHDVAGNSGAVTASRPYEVNTSPPAGTALTIDRVAGDDIVNASEAAPSNTETISGSVTGEFTAGDVVTLTIGSFTTTTTVGVGGLWSADVAGDVLAAGASIEASLVARNAVGNEATVTASRAYVVDTELPDNTSTTLFFDPVTADNIVNASEAATTLNLSGSVTGDYQAGDVITLVINGAQYSGSVATGGAWTVTNVAGSDLAADSDRVIDASLAARDNAGNVGTIVGQHGYIVDVAVPAAPGLVVIDDVGSIVGDVASNGGVTDDTTPTYQGTGEIGATISLVINNAAAVSVLVDGDGNWAYTAPLAVIDGTYTVVATQTDVAGNVSNSVSTQFNVDTQAPTAQDGYDVAISSYTDDVQPQTGVFLDGSRTNDTSPLLNGTVAGLVPGDRVLVYEGATLLGAATVNAGSWTFQVVNAAEGPHSYTATVVDAAGNEGVVSAPLSLIVDITAPSAADGYAVAITGYVDDVDPQTGTFSSGTSTNDASPLLNGTVAGLTSGDQVQIYEGSTLLGSAAVSGGGWTFQVANALDGAHTYTAVVVDAAGNQGVTSNAFTLIVDTQAPSAADGYAVVITTFTDDVEASVGDYPSGTSTNDSSPLLSGSVAGLQSGDYIRIYQGSTLLGIADVNGGVWSFQVTGASDGSYSYVAKVVDAAGNEGLESAPFELTIDTAPPPQTATIESFSDDSEPSTGDFASGSTTDDPTPVLNGSLSAAIDATDTVLIYEGTTLLGSAIVSGTTWTFAIPDQTLVGGSLHTYTAVVADQAGNEGQQSAGFTLISVVEINAQTTLDTTPIISGRIPYSLVDGAQLDVTVNGKTYTSSDGSVVVDSLNSTWYVQIPAGDTLAVGTYQVQAQILNGDGTAGAQDVQTDELIVAPTPDATFGAAGGDGNNKGTTVTMSNSGNWEFFSNQVVYSSTGTDSATIAQYSGTTLTSNTGGAGFGAGNMNMVQNATYIDINRDGYMDIVGIDSRYSNGQQMFINNGDGTYTAQQMADTNASGDNLANVYSWYGGVIAIDFRGDGYVDVVFGDQTPNDASAPGGYNSQFVQNNSGVFIKDAVYTFTRANGGQNTGNATPDQELSGVDLDNDGTVDVVFHATDGSNKIGAADSTGTATSSNSARLVVVKNDGAGGFITSQIINNAVLFTGDPNIANEPSMTWADYNGDGYMDLFMGRVHGANAAAQNNSTIFFNDGAGNLASTDAAGVGTATGTYQFNDTVRGGASLALDWNGDGRMDIIEAPQIGEGTAAVAGTVNLYINQTSGGTSSFDTSYLQPNDVFGSNPATASTFSGAINASGVVTGNPVTGMISVDIDYDGAKDLLIFTSNGTTTYVRNTNAIADDTSMHVRIVDPQGITAYFGNTVKLVNSAGVVVSTQIINPQSGGQTNDSTSLVDFYGLDPNETYSIVLLRNTNGTASHVGAESVVAGSNIQSVNSTWGGLKAGEADSAYVLTAQGEAEPSNTVGAGVVGTGYNDTFFATLGTSRYEGGGGTTEASNYKSWASNGGMDIVDFKLADSTALTIDLTLTAAQNTGWNTVTLSDIEGVAGAAGNDTFTDDERDNFFEGRGGNDTFNLINGGRDTLLYKVLEGAAGDGTGGNGSDIINGFTVGTWQATPDADRIDLSELLVGYTAGGGARYINGVATIAGDETIGQFLSVTSSGGSTTVSIDRDGDGSAYSPTALVTLNGVSVDLATLLANQQLVVV
ncbi:MULTISPECIES: Ig-like domain-containing protein [Pseudomonas]|uniref:Bacterial Ig-like domain-containing protein n=1 Tax=Pseudomonas fulva TaxID=47880 RepID=A0A0D0KYQ9_9PSED|nr:MULTISPECIES: Ig-like domain-containing protein [Pseudomonas]KIQ02455.1 hypothetical protein RU08_07600 [Pseudomonas fulva]